MMKGITLFIIFAILCPSAITGAVYLINFISNLI